MILLFNKILVVYYSVLSAYFGIRQSVNVCFYLDNYLTNT